MKLYSLSKGSKIQIETMKGKEFVIFDHIDGMYSYCYLETDHSKLLHLSASTPLKKVKDYYIIKQVRKEKPMANKTLLQKAKEVRVPYQIPDEPITKEHIELALAWLKGEVTNVQFSKVLGYQSTSGLYKIHHYLKEAYITGKLIIK